MGTRLVEIGVYTRYNRAQKVGINRGMYLVQYGHKVLINRGYKFGIIRVQSLYK
jgi:hypothetical protein